MSADCIFCRIITGDVPSDLVYTDEEMVAFRDINPVASTHILVVPREHIESVPHLQPGHEGLVGRMVMRARALAEDADLASRGYRLVVNSGPEGGQMVPHLHLHLIGGRRLKDQMG